MEENKRYQLVIVEDQTNVREGLKQYFQDCDLGFQVCASFSDGAAAYDWLKTHTDEVDVVLTDIRMPKVTGLQLAQMISEEGWKFKIVFLSLYQEFEYAKAALNLGVYAYLTKPIQFFELDQVFSNLKIAMDKEFSMKNDINLLREELFNQVFSEIYTGTINEKENLHRKLVQFRNGEELLNEPYAEIIFRQNLVEGSEKWHYGAERFVNFILNLLRNDRFLYYVVKNENDFLHILAFSKVIGAFANRAVFEEALAIAVDEGVNNIRQIIDTKVEVESVAYYDSFLESWEFKSFENKKSIIAGYETKLNSTIEKALSYIEDHYGKEISLADVAEVVSLNPVSFSRLFKDFTGENFTDYLILKRIEKAKEALRNSHTNIQDISIMVGYRDEKYFMRLFKKKTGMTPNEYRRMGEASL